MRRILDKQARLKDENILFVDEYIKKTVVLICVPTLDIP